MGQLEMWFTQTIMLLGNGERKFSVLKVSLKTTFRILGPSHLIFAQWHILVSSTYSDHMDPFIRFIPRMGWNARFATARLIKNKTYF